MTTEKLYEAIETTFKIHGYNLKGVWDKITYASKICMCENMVSSGEWKNLPADVLEYTNKFELYI